MIEAERRFPSRIKIGTRSVGWIECEIQGWLRHASKPGGRGHPDGMIIVTMRFQTASRLTLPSRAGEP
jgi:hypothetical protein